jgi:hypothetical protein
MLWTIAAVAWLVFAVFGAWVAAQKDRGQGEGFVLGFLFGPLGVLIEALLPAGKPAEPPSPKPAGPSRWEKPLRPVDEDEPEPDLSAFGPPKPPKRGWDVPKGRPKPPPDDPPEALDELRL